MARRCESWHGAAAQGKDSFELVAVTRMFWLGRAWHVHAGPGKVRRGLARQGLF